MLITRGHVLLFEQTFNEDRAEVEFIGQRGKGQTNYVRLSRVTQLFGLPAAGAPAMFRSNDPGTP